MHVTSEKHCGSEVTADFGFETKSGAKPTKNIGKAVDLPEHE